MLVLLCVFPLTLSAQRRGIKDIVSDYYYRADTIPRSSDGLFFFPLLYYSPDTRFGAGAVGVYYFHLKDKAGASTRLSFARLLADYTQNDQLDIWSTWNVFTRREAYLIKGEARYRNFVDRFYGIGPHSNVDDETFYYYDLIDFKLLGARQVKDKLFFGPDFRFTNFFDVDLEEGAVDWQKVTGTSGGLNVGLGLVALYDSRDNSINAYEGSLIEASSYLFNSAIGSDYNYSNINLIATRYWEVSPRHVVAAMFQQNSNFGEVPFINLAAAGGDDILRGYARNRFRDDHFTAAQIEYRFPLFWRIGAAAFAGAGDVYSTPEEVTLPTLKYSYGGGLRVSINEYERINLRLDYGFGNGSQSFYLQLTEAF